MDDRAITLCYDTLCYGKFRLVTHVRSKQGSQWKATFAAIVHRSDLNAHWHQTPQLRHGT